MAVRDSETKDHLRRYLQDGRDAVLWKLDGASEYDVRRPIVPTGTNLLGVVKHLAGVEIGYFGNTFGRPYEGWVPYMGGESDPTGDMWAAADESRDAIVGMYRSVWAHSDATIEELSLSATGRVPWWPQERAAVTLAHVLVRVTAETNRHAGQADILRELVDGAAGWVEGNDNMPERDAAWWAEYRAKLEAVARAFAEPS